MENFILSLYFLSLSILFGFGIHGLVLLIYYRKTSKETPKELLIPEDLPQVTIQLPMYNEMYVVERLIKSVCNIEYPKDKLEVQILDDSTDETQTICQNIVKEYQMKGFDISYIHRTNRQGFKAGALKEGLVVAKGEFVAIFDADFIPKREFLMKTIPHFQTLILEWCKQDGNTLTKMNLI